MANTNSPNSLRALSRQGGGIRRPDHGRDPATMYYTIPQVAAMRLCRKTTVHHAILERRLPAWTIGGIYLIPREDAEAWALRPGHPSASARDNATARKLARLQRAAARRSFEQDGHEAAPRADAIYEEPPCATE